MPRLRPLRSLASATLVLVLAAGGAAAQGTGRPQALPTERLVIRTAHGPRTFTVQVADTPTTREIGLMYVRRMPDAHGMVFEFDRPSEQAFWMHNTLIPLDIIYIGPNGRIVSIARDARPMDETPLPSHGEAARVLEINGGLAKRLGIAPGDLVEDPAPLPPL